MAEKRKRVRQERLDHAWEWERSESLKLGIERSEEELRKDEVTRKRIERRMREKREVEMERDREQWDKIEGRSASTPTAREEELESERELPDWRKHRNAIKERFPEGWAPPKRISREAMDLLRALHKVDPGLNSVPMLADKFRISPEAVRRVLKSRFELGREEREKREGKRREERMRQTEGGGGDGAWSGDRGRERGEMERLRNRRRNGDRDGER